MVRGGAAGVLALLKRAQDRGVRGSLANAAERFLRRQVELEDASPFDAAPAARAEHAARMSEAQGPAAPVVPTHLTPAPPRRTRHRISDPRALLDRRAATSSRAESAS